jgi:hypothetical protein
MLSQTVMPTLPVLARYAALLLISGFALVVGWRLLNGGIRTDGLLDSFEGGKRRSSPGRLQLLLFTAVAAGQYLSAVIQNPAAPSLPAPPQALLAALAGSQAVYLGGKAISAYLPMLRNRDRRST